MRKELYGPLPVALGVLVVAAVALTVSGPPPPECGCPVRSPSDLGALDASGFAGVGNGEVLVVDGRLASIAPPTLVDAPYHVLRLEGSSVEFNVTQFDGAVPFEGAWVRLTTVHQGQTESGGPDTGHRWRYVGPTVPGGDAVVSLSGVSAGLAGIVWGVATLPAFRRARTDERSLRERLARARQGARDEPALARDGESLALLAAADRAVRRGQYDTAGETLSRFEELLDRAKAVGRMSAEMGETVDAQESRFETVGGSKARAALAEANKLREAGKVAEAEAALERAMAELRAGGRAGELVDRARRLAGEPGADEDAAGRAQAALDRAEERLRAGTWASAESAAEEAVSVALEASPAAARAARAIQDLEDAAAWDRASDAPREVAHQIASARAARSAGDFARALALARAARWVVDAESLDEEGLRKMLAIRWGEHGWRAQVGAGRPPVGGLVFARADDRVLLVTAGWREYPTERVLLSAKDFVREGHATRARVYSSAFANTSTDPAVVVVTLRELLEELTEAAALDPAVQA